ncbi:hypothetical protein B0H19DRAFT_1256908 [Mycena capillaripes]|nr:hypothetical protein B0H19DRAFT_1256908 [Mycena capillaripes]
MNSTIYLPIEDLDFLFEEMQMQLYQTCASTVVYVISTILLSAAIFILSRRRASGTNVLLAACCAMLVLSTILIVVDAAALSVYIQACRVQLILDGPYGPGLITYDALVKTQRIVFSVDSFVTDLLYRCYVIWNGRLTVLIFPGLLMLMTLAGRIWWMQREASFLDAEKVTFKTRYTLAIAIIVESGALYIILAFVTIFATETDELSYALAAITQGVAQQAINVIPALTIVRVGLGRSLHETITTNAKLNSKEPTRERLPKLTFARPVLDSTPGASVIHITPIEEIELVDV